MHDASDAEYGIDALESVTPQDAKYVDRRMVNPMSQPKNP